MLNNLFFDEQHLYLAKIHLIGIICQGIFHYYNKKELDIQTFALYLLLSFISSLLYFKIFNKKK